MISDSISSMDLFVFLFIHRKMHLMNENILSEAEVFLDILACIWYNIECRAKHV